MNSVERDIECAAINYKHSDGGRWAAAYFAARVVGRKPVVYGATLDLATRLGKSVDTVEDLAHAYDLYAEFRSDARYRHLIQRIRRLPYVHYSSFRALYEARENYHLSLEQIFGILIDIVHAEGSLSQRDLETHIHSRWGDTRDWTYYSQKTFKQIHILLSQPDLPANVKSALMPAYEVLAGDKE